MIWIFYILLNDILNLDPFYNIDLIGGHSYYMFSLSSSDDVVIVVVYCFVVVSPAADQITIIDPQQPSPN